MHFHNRVRPRLATGRIVCALTALFALSHEAWAGYTAVDLYTMSPPSGLTHPSAGIDTGGFHSTDSGQVGGFGRTSSSPSSDQAILWSAAGVGTNLNPTNLSGYTSSAIQGVSGTQQVGFGAGTATGSTPSKTIDHAMLWNGLASSAVDLQPTLLTGFAASGAFDTDGTTQVGYAVTSGSGLDNAMLWTGTADSAVNLQPSKFASYYDSVAYCVSGSQQVGVLARIPAQAGFPNKPMLWSGTAASAVDLTPTTLGTTFDMGAVAYGIGGRQEVGYASNTLTTIGTHAIVWAGTGTSAIDLNPTGSVLTVAYGTNGHVQVGYMGVTIGNAPSPTPEAMMWLGTATSAFNLQTLLPSNFGASEAFSVDASGNVFGVAEDTSGNYHAIEWVVPEPSSCVVFGLIAAWLQGRRRRSAVRRRP